MNILAFSDLHILSPKDPMYLQWIRALQESLNRVTQTKTPEAWVMNGDLFDLWVGPNRDMSLEYPDFFAILSQAQTLKIDVHWIMGNHDFHLHPKDFPGVKIHDEWVMLHDPVQNKRTVFAHGDLANPEDKGYLRLRAGFRGWLGKLIAHLGAPTTIECIAKQFSRTPEEMGHSLPETCSQDQQKELRKIFHQYAGKLKSAHAADYVILGHCHDLDEAGGFYWNMGFPKVHGAFLAYFAEQGSWSRVKFS